MSTNSWDILASQIDASVNHIVPAPDGGYFESRYVQRCADYAICYLSSHSGCSHSCRFCHLTATGQTMMTPADLSCYVSQAWQVMNTYASRIDEGMQPVKKWHFNFMARGEALSNPSFIHQSQELFDKLCNTLPSQLPKPEVRFCVSTIFPQDFKGDLVQILADPRAVPYYSLYSMNPSFRKRWLAKAMPAEQALEALADFQTRTGREIVLHWAFIAGQNDSHKDIDDVCRAIERHNIKARFNLVRYNPHDERYGQEPEEIALETLFDRISQVMQIPGSRIVPRVGFDVKASCGMFVGERARRKQVSAISQIPIAVE